MKILFVTLLVLLVGCATEQEKIEYREAAQIAEDRFQEVKKYCDAKGLPTNVECEGGRACHKYPNSREKMTAYCVIWRDKAKFPRSTIDGRTVRDMQRMSERRQ